MTAYSVKDSDLDRLKGKTILITGAASGIGRATAILAHHYVCNVILGDWNDELGRQLSDELQRRCIFRKTDVASWDDILELFEVGWRTFGVIHAVIANAGINTEGGTFMDDRIDETTGKLLRPDLTTMDVNLTGVIYTAKCALHYFSKWPETRCQLVLTGSAASYLDTAPLYLYCASKAGVLGLMRSLRTQMLRRNVTVNMIAPWFTKTPMLLDSFLEVWGDLPANTPTGVAKVLLLPMVFPDINGKSFFVQGDVPVEFEETLQKAQPIWAGQPLSDRIDEGQRRILP